MLTDLTHYLVCVSPMHTLLKPLRAVKSAVYGLAWPALLLGLCLLALHDDRYSVDRSCAKYASPKACRVF